MQKERQTYDSHPSEELLFGDFAPSMPSEVIGGELEERAPTPAFDVNELQCYRYSHELPRLLKLRQNTESFFLSHLPRADQIRALGHIVGICDRLNWDFTLGPLAAALWSMTEGFNSQALARLTLSDFRAAFGKYRRSDGRIGYSTRLRKLRDIAAHFYAQKVPERLGAATRVFGNDGALGLLLATPTFRDDPLHKKCNALLHELVRRQLVFFEDSFAIPPAIDYHILRLYLRTGRVEVLDEEVRRRLIARSPMRIELLTELRTITAQAVIRTAWLSGLSVSILNDSEWAFTRQACRRDEVWCAQHRCPIATVCPSAGLEHFAMLFEPKSMHGHY
jgi:hypothetical protein